MSETPGNDVQKNDFAVVFFCRHSRRVVSEVMGREVYIFPCSTNNVLHNGKTYVFQLLVLLFWLTNFGFSVVERKIYAPPKFSFSALLFTPDLDVCVCVFVFFSVEPEKNRVL